MAAKRAVELVYFDGCPNVDEARRGLKDALARSGAPADWKEWDQLAEDTPVAYRSYPSPTVLVDGADVQDTDRVGGMACRAGGGPTLIQILTALEGR